MSGFITDVSWETNISNVAITWDITDPPTHIYTCEVSPINPSDKGSGDIVIGYYLVDFLGNVYEITNITGSTITVYDINEGAQTTEEFVAPYQDQIGFIYKQKKDGSIYMSQSDIRRLDQSARDLINQIDNNMVDSKLADYLALDQTIPQIIINGTPTFDEGVNVPYINFDTLYADGVLEGRLQWNSEDGTLEVGLPGGNVNLQIGQETLIKVTNKTGGNLLNGQVVYINGAQGSRPTIALSRADSISTKDVCGILTEDINNNQSGYMTAFGLVRDINTTGIPVGETWVAGDKLYLNSTIAGALTNVLPTGVNYITPVAIVLFANATEGVLHVCPKATIPKPTDIGAELYLGNPAVDGYVLSSTVAGVRSWIEFPTPVNYWQRNGTVLSPATPGDILAISQITEEVLNDGILIDSLLTVNTGSAPAQSSFYTGIIINAEQGISAINDILLMSQNYTALYIESVSDSLLLMSSPLGKIGFFGATPTVQSANWNADNVSATKTYNSASTSINELSNVLGSLIEELIAKGLIGAVTP